MKKILTILSILLIGFTVQVSAQTRKKAKKKVTTTKTATVTKTQAPAPAETKTTTTVTTRQTEPAGKPVVAKRSVKSSSDDYYTTALGLKFLYGIAVTGKHFISDKGALEGILQYRHFSGLGNEINFTALYEYHNNIAGVDGLRWYVGGGGHVSHLSVDDDAFGDLVGESSSTAFGVGGVVGLEYKFKNTPIAISADWQPIYILNGDSGFASDNGGFGVKYTF